MNTKYKILILYLLLPLFSVAQVGIGNISPDSNSVLDLTNTKNAGLLLPKATTSASMESSQNLLYYFNDYIYYKSSVGYNAISPWIYKQNNLNNKNIYFNLNGNIGIGNSDITVPPEAPLQIETDKNVSLDSNGSLMLGDINSDNLILNSNEIQARNSNNASELIINNKGGDAIIGSKQSLVDVKVTGKVQELDSNTNTYYDLMPKGLITAWFGLSTNIPVGWAICDGGTYPNSNGVDSTTTPDLRGKFIVSVGDNGTNNYAPHDTGGADFVSLSISEIPSHDHNVRSAGSHNHTYSYDKVNNKKMVLISSPHRPIDEPDEMNYYTGYTYSSSANIYQSGAGQGVAHENRPVFYSLVFIIKL